MSEININNKIYKGTLKGDRIELHVDDFTIDDWAYFIELEDKHNYRNDVLKRVYVKSDRHIILKNVYPVIFDEQHIIHLKFSSFNFIPVPN